MQGFMDIMPTFILAGLKAAGNMLPAVGMGILAMMTWSKEEGMFLLIGFVLAAYLKLDSMAIALLGASICVIEFFKLIKASEGTNISAQKEEFFQ
jgi:mannose/fructose/N-acetylgalactosamine-specific phosphotransferase system component IIC